MPHGGKEITDRIQRKTVIGIRKNAHPRNLCDSDEELRLKPITSFLTRDQ